MATLKPTTPDDPGMIVLVTPFGAGRSRRLVIPADVAEWLMDEIGTALAEMKAERRAARKRARKRAKGQTVPPLLSSTF